VATSFPLFFLELRVRRLVGLRVYTKGNALTATYRLGLGGGEVGELLRRVVGGEVGAQKSTDGYLMEVQITCLNHHLNSTLNGVFLRTREHERGSP